MLFIIQWPSLQTPICLIFVFNVFSLRYTLCAKILHNHKVAGMLITCVCVLQLRIRIFATIHGLIYLVNVGISLLIEFQSFNIININGISFKSNVIMSKCRHETVEPCHQQTLLSTWTCKFYSDIYRLSFIHE